MSPLLIVIPGTPTPWQRTNAVGGRRLTPASMRRAKAHVRACTLAARPRKWSTDLEYGVRLDCFRRRIASARPDVDNLAKLIYDGANGLLWSDDSQIVSDLGTHKWDVRDVGGPERTEVRVWVLGADRWETHGPHSD